MVWTANGEASLGARSLLARDVFGRRLPVCPGNWQKEPPPGVFSPPFGLFSLRNVLLWPAFLSSAKRPRAYPELRQALFLTMH